VRSVILQNHYVMSLSLLFGLRIMPNFLQKIIMLSLLFLGDLRKASQLLLVNGLLRANSVLP